MGVQMRCMGKLGIINKIWEKHMTRREMREAAFTLIFAQILNKIDPEEVIAAASEIDDMKLNEAAKKLFKDVVIKSDALDEIISNYSRTRIIARIPTSSLAILRLALYEILYDESMPMNVAISEAVLLSKKYSDDADVSFINGVLGAYSRDCNEKGKIQDE